MLRSSYLPQPTADRTNREFTYMRADIERAAQAVCAAAEFDWTWTVTDLLPFCQLAEWQLSTNGYGVSEVTTNLDINRPDAPLFVADAPNGELPQVVEQIWFRASDVILDRDDLQPELDEIFDNLVQRIFEALGRRPTGWWIEPSRGLRWELPAVVVTAVIGDTSVFVHLVSPEHQRWNEEIERYSELD